MNKISFFYRLNRQHVWKYVMLFVVFTFAGVVVSGTLFIQENNRGFYEAQINMIQQEGQIEGDAATMQHEFQIVFERVEDVLGVFSFASIVIVVWGGANLLFFKDLSMQKSYAMCRIYGMEQKDLMYKALGDLLIYGIAAGIVGSGGGFFLFRYLAEHICKTGAVFSFFSLESLITMTKVTLILSVIAFFGSFASGVFVYQKHIMSVLFERKVRVNKKGVWCVAGAGGTVLALLILLFFRGDKKYIVMVLAAFFVTGSLLFTIFYFFFSKQTKKHRNKKPLQTMVDLSYRFLCTRYKKDAVLAATVSVGAVLICFIMNLVFNFSEIITDSYRDNMGYSVGVRMTEWAARENVAELLDENGYPYTLVYTKIMDLSELNDSQKEGMFWAAVVGEQTDTNPHFHVDPGTFYAESSFEAKAGIEEGKRYGILGKDLEYGKLLLDNQAMSLVSYSILVNQDDWGYGLDDSFSAIFLMDVDKVKEVELKKLLKDSPCEIETAGEIVDALSDLMKDYLSVVLVVGGMLVLVIGTFFYSMIQNDLLERKTEMYLYQVYGASLSKARGVIFLEYLMIALLSSFSVVFVIMVLGELFFFYMLQKHYPISIVVVLLTTLAVTVFVLLCCLLAGSLNKKGQQLELIRDE